MSKELTIKEQATNFHTMNHINLVQKKINKLACELISRGEDHDASKLSSPEVELFTEFTPKLAATTYGSEEYNEHLKNMGPALAHHYANNRHHPDHFKNGIDDFNLLDLVEFFCDCASACQRQNDGNLRKSIEINATRFNINPQLVKILENSIDLVEG